MGKEKRPQKTENLYLAQVAGYEFSPRRRRVFAETKQKSRRFSAYSLRLCGESFPYFDNRQLRLSKVKKASHRFYQNYGSKKDIIFQSFHLFPRFFIFRIRRNQKQSCKLKIVISHCSVLSGYRPKESEHRSPRRNKRIAIGCPCFAGYTKCRRDKLRCRFCRRHRNLRERACPLKCRIEPI